MHLELVAAKRWCFLGQMICGMLMLILVKMDIEWFFAIQKKGTLKQHFGFLVFQKKDLNNPTETYLDNFKIVADCIGPQRRKGLIVMTRCLLGQGAFTSLPNERCHFSFVKNVLSILRWEC